jgi:hypothetical protein
MGMTDTFLEDSVPVEVITLKGRLWARCCALRGQRFDAPMFQETAAGLSGRRGVPQSLVPVEQLGELPPGLEPRGFIFHMSRCGSTLVSRMLAESARCTVVSEAQPISAVLGATALSQARRRALLKRIVSALGRRPQGSEAYYFIKFTSWNVLHLPVIREAYPDVPWIFVYRNPVEIIASHAKNPAPWLVAGGPRSSEMPVSVAGVFDEAGTLGERCAGYLAAFARAVLEAPGEGGVLVNYEALPGALQWISRDHFGVEFSQTEWTAMKERACFDAKKGGRVPFVAADPVNPGELLVGSSAHRLIQGLYERLEERRVRQPVGFVRRVRPAGS